MDSKRIAAGLFAAALAALLAWAGVTAAVSRCLTFGEKTEVNAEKENDVLFDDDSTVDFSEPSLPVFEPAPPAEKDGVFEFSVTPEYFLLLAQTYGDEIPLRNLSVHFDETAIVLSGDAVVSEVARLAGLPAALTVFLPETLPCRLECVPSAENGRLRVKVTRADCSDEAIRSFFASGEVLAAVENYINGLAERCLPRNYRMEHVSLSADGIYVRFSVERPAQ